jgi:hypothetical protein
MPKPEPPAHAPKPSHHRHLLADCIGSYLTETEIHKSAKTLAAYRTTLILFVSAMRDKDIEDFTAEVMSDFVC